jgi:hypothetical protein
MVAAPILAAIKAHVAATQAYADFFKDVCLVENGGVRMVRFTYEESVHDDAGNPTGQVEKRIIDMPLVAAIPLPAFGVDNVTVDFDLEINTVDEKKSKTATEVAVSAKWGFGPWGVQVNGKVSHQRESTRKTDTRSKYAFHVEASRMEPPEAVNRVIDHILASMKPIAADKASALAAPAAPAAAPAKPPK